MSAIYHISNGRYNSSTKATEEVRKTVPDEIIMLTEFYYQRRLLIQFLSVSISFFISLSSLPTPFLSPSLSNLIIFIKDVVAEVSEKIKLMDIK